MKPKYLGKALTFGDLIANCYHAYGKYKVQGFCGLLSKVAASDFAAMRRATERMGAQVGFESVKTATSGFNYGKQNTMKTILQVEDDPNDMFFLQHAMKKAGVANPIQVASDGQQAIEYLQGTGKFADREQFPLPCLVLLDLKLPHVMGLDVLKWICEQSGMALVVVLLTASGEDADIAAAYRLGANGFLVKPSEASKLEDMVRAINGFWLMQNTPPSDSLLDRRLETLANPCTQGLAGHRFPTGTSSLAQIPSGIFPADI